LSDDAAANDVRRRLVFTSCCHSFLSQTTHSYKGAKCQIIKGMVVNATTTTRNTTKKKKKTSGQNRQKGLLKESIKLINAKYHEKAIKGIQSGVLRDNPSMV
jgi:hypothetical protein